MPGLSQAKRTAIGTAFAILAAGVTAAPAAAAPSQSLRVVAPVENQRAYRGVAGRVTLDFGMLVAAVGGDVELRLRRPDFSGPVDAWEADPLTGATIQTLPPAAVNGFDSLRRFFRITIVNNSGKQVVELYRAYCPNSPGRARIAASGPLTPRYPSVCGRTFAPFTRGAVWGVEQGWATPAFAPRLYFSNPRFWSVALKPGVYRVTYEITPFFQAFFRVAPENASATTTLTVANYRSSRSKTGAAPPVRASAGAPAVPVDLDPDPETLPDLMALPAWNIAIRHSDRRDLLAFASTPWNAGPAPLVVEGFRNGTAPTMAAYQYFYDDAGTAVGQAPVGTFMFDKRKGHHHWHFMQFVRYSILNATTHEVVRSAKQSFCLTPSDAIDLTVDRAVFLPFAGGVASTCGRDDARSLREALPAGWGDTYFQNVAGQAFDITSVPNGTYRIRVAMNPLGELYERSTANNVEDRTIVLGGRKGRRTVRVAPWHGIAG